MSSPLWYFIHQECVTVSHQHATEEDCAGHTYREVGLLQAIQEAANNTQSLE